MHDIPRRLLQRLDELGTELERRGDSIALIGLGSVGPTVLRAVDAEAFGVLRAGDAAPIRRPALLPRTPSLAE